MGLFKKARAFFSTSEDYASVEISDAKHLKGKGVKVPFQGFPFEISLGSDTDKLHLFPERLIKSSPEETPSSFILFNPEHFHSQISGFIRIERDKKLVLGRSDPDQTAFFSYSDRVNERHLAITYQGDAFIFQDLHSDAGTTLSALKNPDQTSQIIRRRQEKLSRIREIYGGPILPLPLAEAQSDIEKVCRIMSQEIWRPQNSQGRPGAVVQLPDEITPILMGDLHAQLDNLINVLCQNQFLESLENGTACLILLGDAVHSEIDDQMADMIGSMLIMDFIFKLKIRFPNQIFHVRGNHDSFAPFVSKGGIPQGLLWEKHLTDERGPQYKQAMELYYDQLPYLVLTKDFFACHASPPSRNVNLEKLIDASEDQGLTEQLIQNRVKQPRYPGGYTPRDVKRFRKGLGLEPNFPFIVAHNPLTDTETLWLNVGKIENHHIIFSAKPHSIGVFTRISDGVFPLLYKTEPLLETISALEPTEIYQD
ncbi:metallophosphoesterase [Desulfococcaceae bacterium HSG7]|nr:metallophosphoesterase [Desulfococcaceae bacterium HSG7]